MATETSLSKYSWFHGPTLVPKPSLAPAFWFLHQRLQLRKPWEQPWSSISFLSDKSIAIWVATMHSKSPCQSVGYLDMDSPTPGTPTLWPVTGKDTTFLIGTLWRCSSHTALIHDLNWPYLWALFGYFSLSSFLLPDLSPSASPLSVIFPKVWCQTWNTPGLVFPWVCWWACVCPPSGLEELEGRRRGWRLCYNPAVRPRNSLHWILHPGCKARWPRSFSTDQAQAPHSLWVSWHVYSRGVSARPPCGDV